MIALSSTRSTAELITVLLLVISACLSPPTARSSPVSQHCNQASVQQPPIDLATMVDEFVQSIPAGDTSGYADPKGDPEGVDALVQGFVKITEGDLMAACQVLTPVAYRVVLTTDSKTGQDVVLVFREANARYLFINGADRRANGEFRPSACERDSRCADVAHQPESPFEDIHEKAVAPLGSNAKVYQSHRFLAADHDAIDNVAPETSGPANVVVSAGTAPSPIAQDVADRIEAEDSSFFHVCLFNDSQDCSKLGPTNNTQKNHMSGGRFVHVEASDKVIRASCGTPCRRDELAAAIAKGMK